MYLYKTCSKARIGEHLTDTFPIQNDQCPVSFKRARDDSKRGHW
jgi:hypothetical protein